eukprot:243346-Prymnesium_polylepis.1
MSSAMRTGSRRQSHQNKATRRPPPSGRLDLPPLEPDGRHASRPRCAAATRLRASRLATRVARRTSHVARRASRVA